jgi:hypothetical protein
MRYLPVVLITTLIIFISNPEEIKGGNNTEIQIYVGAKACEPCHKKEYESFIKYAKKSDSFQSIQRVKKGLTEEEIKQCYFCHTTGYGKPGGFVSAEETPHLKNAGCEVCHGPGGLHVRTQRAQDIKNKLTMEDCEVCHTSERVKAFRYKPLIHGGAH